MISKKMNQVIWSGVLTLSSFGVTGNGIADAAIPTPLYGVTVDDVDGLPVITEALKKLPQKMTVRIVFDEDVKSPSQYRQAAAAIHKDNYVMGEILDSFYVPKFSVEQYKTRTGNYLKELGDVVDIWEIGNEINGEWVGKTADVVAKMTGAYDIVKAQGKTTALTLYYNEDCWEKKQNEMFTWTEANVPKYMKEGLDYVLVSYYQKDCNNLKPDWQKVFKKLAVMFPNSKLGIGEAGFGHDYESKVPIADKVKYLTDYYTMQIAVPNYIGGYFWWYARQELMIYPEFNWCSAKSCPLWDALYKAIEPKQSSEKSLYKVSPF